MRCPPRETLARFVESRLSLGEFEPLEAHIEECVACQRTLDSLTRADDLAWQLPGVRPVATSRRCMPRPRLRRYRLEGEGRQGGHGIVYRAVDVALDRVVAVKVLRDGSLAGREARARFEIEARAVARLSHPNVVAIHGVEEADDRPAIVMEWVPGGSLADRLDGVPLTEGEAARLVEALAGAVAHAHASGVLHRDIKPANILLPGRDLADPKLGDFGLAKLTTQEGDRTPTAAILGTPGYMAPELIAGGPSAAAPASDIYSLGAVLYELLTGRPPFRAATPFETFRLVLEREPVAPRSLRPSLGRDLETICLSCLEKDPARRYASAEALRDDLGRFLRGLPVKARPIGPATRLARWCRRHPAVSTLSGVLAASLLVGLVVLTALWQRAEHRRAAAMEGLRLYAPLAKRIFEHPEDTTEAEREGLNRAIDLSLALLAETGGDPDAEHRAAFAMLELAGVLESIGQIPRAESVCRGALTVLERLARDHPERHRAAFNAAQGLMQLSGLLTRQGRVAEATRLHALCARNVQRLVAEHPESDEYRGTLASFHVTLAHDLCAAGEIDSAEARLRRAVEVLRDLRRKYPEDPYRYGYLSNGVWNLIELLVRHRGDPDEAASLARELLDLAEDLRRGGREGWVQCALRMGSVMEIAWALDPAGRRDEATSIVETYLAQARHLAALRPSEFPHRLTLGLQLHETGLRLVATDPPAASARFREARSVLERLAEDSGVPLYRSALAVLLATCPDPDVRDLDRALAEADRVVRDDPTQTDPLTICLVALGRHEDAAAHHPETDQARLAHAEALHHLARHDEARAELHETSLAIESYPFRPPSLRLALERARRLINPNDPTPRAASTPTNPVRAGERRKDDKW